MKNVKFNAKEMFVALVAKTIFKPKNSVMTPFFSATNLRQTHKACRKKKLDIFCSVCGLTTAKSFN